MKYFYLVVAFLLFVGCAPRANNDLSKFETAHEMLTNLSSYQAMVYITYISNNGENKYRIMQEANIDGRYRVEVLEPLEVAGNVTVFDGTTIHQFNKNVPAQISVGVSEVPERSEIFLTSFIRNYLTSNTVSVAVSNVGDTEFVELSAVIPGDNDLLASQVLYLERETNTPVRLVIFDKANEPRVVIEYIEFVYNPELSEDVFTINTEPQTQDEVEEESEEDNESEETP